MPLENVIVVLHKLRFPENAGMAARACANMGIQQIRLSAPRNWECLKAWPVATSVGQPLLNNITVYESLLAAISDCHSVYGTSARTGGWRKKAQNPVQGCAKIKLKLNEGEKVALLFGPEDRGLSNDEIALCSGIIHIETARDASSLNIAQAVLLVLYELRRKQGKNAAPDMPPSIRMAELQLLESKLKNALASLHCLEGANPDYAFGQWHDMLSRARLRHNEYAALMGLCRQVENFVKINEKLTKNKNFHK